MVGESRSRFRDRCRVRARDGVDGILRSGGLFGRMSLMKKRPKIYVGLVGLAEKLAR